MRTRELTGAGVIVVASLVGALALLPVASSAQVGNKGESDDSGVTLQRTVEAMNGRLLQLERRVSSLEKKKDVSKKREAGTGVTEVGVGSLQVIGKEVYRVRGRLGEYSGAMEGHWIKKRIARGLFILLEDDSLWKIDAVDRITTGLWLPVTEIIVLPHRVGDVTLYDLVNVDDDEKVYAAFGGYATRAR